MNECGSQKASESRMHCASTVSMVSPEDTVCRNNPKEKAMAAYDLVPDFDDDVPQHEPIRRLNRDLRAAAALLDPAEVRYVIDRFYQTQDDRKRGNNQRRAAEADREPNALIAYLADQQEEFEAVYRSVLLIVARSTVVGRWLLSLTGVGPILAAGVQAHFKFEGARSASSYWRLAGYDPSQRWLGKEKADALVREVRQIAGSRDPQVLLPLCAERVALRPEVVLKTVAWQRTTAARNKAPVTIDEAREGLTLVQLAKALAVRPWNAAAKQIAYKLGDSFVKVSNRDTDAGYGALYKERKALEWERNLRGQFAEACSEAKSRALTENQAAWYEGRYLAADVALLIATNVPTAQWELAEHPGEGTPMLPPGRIELRARRVAVKMFLSHLYGVQYEVTHGTPAPHPYIIAKDARHTHFYPIPLWPIRP